jgi:hypothetical protein
VPAMKLTLALLLMTATAAAQFKAPQLEGEGNLIGMECVIVKVSPPDHDRDPSYKVNLTAEFYPDNGKVSTFDAVHTAVSGRKYRRSNQYSNGALVGNRTGVQWSGWRFGNTEMIGVLHFDKGRWLYDEQVVKGGRVQTKINTVCHAEVEGE